MKYKKTIFLLLALFLMTTTVSASTIELIKENTGEIKAGDTFRITAYITTTKQIDTIAIDTLEYDGKIIECKKIEKGNFFENDTFWLDGEIKSNKVINVVWGSNIPRKQGEGIFVNYTFKALTDGTTIIKITEPGIASNGKDIPVNTKNISIIVGTGIFEPADTNAETPPINLLLGVGIILTITIVTMLILKRQEETEETEETDEKEEKEETEDDDVFKT